LHASGIESAIVGREDVGADLDDNGLSLRQDFLAHGINHERSEIAD
jgi:hypothetical protein